MRCRLELRRAQTARLGTHPPKDGVHVTFVFKVRTRQMLELGCALRAHKEPTQTSLPPRCAQTVQPVPTHRRLEVHPASIVKLANTIQVPELVNVFFAHKAPTCLGREPQYVSTVQREPIATILEVPVLPPVWVAVPERTAPQGKGRVLPVQLEPTTPMRMQPPV